MTLQAVRDGPGLAFIPDAHAHGGPAIVDLAGVNLQQDWYVLRPRARNAPRAVQELHTFLLGPDARRIVGKAGLKVPAE